MFKKIKYLLVIVLLFGVSVFLNAESNQNIENNLNSEQVNSNSQSKTWSYFYGVPEFWQTQSGTLIISCKPPFNDHCYTLITDPIAITVIINDDEETEFEVTSEPVVTTGDNGEQIYTFDNN